ncbi:MAG: ATP synthase F1 subunit delta [Betaproteobacteria bacterium RIFCSPLOWO2_12_FULL_63_13]|nr:MAG: ATP synthase F1 subunit delta [Betaproteobacteria bacterium RIFCSPLOWO2_02_FULL_63_19]OGA44560.1 MAG: ATP synthase F1 subunit delta [Betaproteobacteria bacterium RIFCSPLOWO2_12_FULL_63_13]
MAESITIARPYAEAVFALADGTGDLEKWSQALEGMAAIANNPDMLDAMVNPRLTAHQLYGMFASLVGDAMFAESQNLVRVLIENRRLSLMPEIRKLFEELKNQREGMVEARITSAFALEAEALAGLVADLEQRFKRRIQPVVAVDAELIGGVCVQVGDEVIDGSVRGKLASMLAALKS